MKWYIKITKKFNNTFETVAKIWKPIIELEMIQNYEEDR